MSTGASTMSGAASTLVDELWPARRSGAAPVRAIALMVLGSALLTLSAKIQVPFVPVPMTLQTLVVLTIGAAFGWRLGGATVLLYLVEGAAGLPVFAGAAAGPAYLGGPTGGFLVGFLAAAVTVGVLAERGWDRPLWRVALLMTIGHVVIFAFGLGWLALLFGAEKAWAGGAQPFILATILKTALAAAIMHAGWSVTRRAA